MKVVNIAPQKHEYDTRHCRIEIRSQGLWENFLSSDEWLSVESIISEYSYWSCVLPVGMRIINKDAIVLATNNK